MKKQIGEIRQKMNSLFFLIATFTIIAIMIYFSKSSNESDNKYFEENGMYTIATIIEYSAHTITGSSAFTRISYIVDGKEFLVESDYNVPFDNGPIPGEMFIAMYLPNEPKKCALLFDYPVKDSADYKRYIEEFKKNPPKLK